MKCRHCGQLISLPFLDLGSAPPSNAYLSKTDLNGPEIWFPLRLLVCENCWLVQTEDHTGREALFTQNYAYFSSYSSTWLAHAQHYVSEMVERFHLDKHSQVVEIAANDGYLLQYVQQLEIPCYGIEPTTSTANVAREKGINIIEQFFGVNLADELVQNNQQADLIVANNVLAHVPDINDFVKGFSLLLKPQGVATFEFPHLLRLVQENQFDTVYHEHYSYLSLTAIQHVFSRNGLTLFDVEELPTHGGSLRVYAQVSNSGANVCTLAVSQLLQAEADAGVDSKEFYQNFQAQTEDVKDTFLEFLLDVKRKGLKIGAYGAAAKGNTLLNFTGVRPDLLPYVVDKNPAKKGQYMPGSRIPIVDEAHLKAHRPDYILILPWNLRTEIISQMAYVREWGAKFVAAVPVLEFL